MVEDHDYFIKFPNKYIHENISEQYGLNKKFYIVYILISKNRACNNYSWISVQNVLCAMGYNTERKNTKIFREVIYVIKYLIAMSMIKLLRNINIDSVRYDTAIEVEIITENFDPQNNFCKLSFSQIDFITNNQTSIRTENILMVFLYVNSYIILRPKNEGEEIMSATDQANNPEVFWRSTTQMARVLGLSKNTIRQCLNYLTTSQPSPKTGETLPPLLLEVKTNSISYTSEHTTYVPNAYALNQAGSSREIQWAINKMLGISVE